LVAKGYRPIDRDQVFLLPPNLRDWLPPEHRIWFVLDIVNQLDLSALHKVSKRGGVGRAGYHPDVLMAVLIYAYMHGRLSSRGIERACNSDVAYMVACGRDVPDHTVIARFRQVHQEALKDLFGQVLVICVKAGMGRFGVVAIDGTKIAGNASMRANRKFSRLKEKAAEVLERSAEVDAAEDIRHGEKGTGLDLLPLWTDPQARPELISDALAELSDEDDDPTGSDCADATDSQPAGTDADANHAGDHRPPDDGRSSTSTEIALRPPAEVAVAGVSARSARFAADKDARVLAAFTSITAQEAARDAAVREPRVAKAQARVTRADDRLARIRARLEAYHHRTAQRIAAGLQRRGPHVPVEEQSQTLLAKQKLADAERNLVLAQASGRRPDRQLDPVGNLTDPDSRKMRCSGGGYQQGYNAQLAVTDDHLILAISISQSVNDQTSGVPMINAAVAAVEKLSTATGLPELEIGMLVLDAGYCSTDTITAPGPDRLIATMQSRAPNRSPVSTPTPPAAPRRPR